MIFNLHATDAVENMVLSSSLCRYIRKRFFFLNNMFSPLNTPFLGPWQSIFHTVPVGLLTILSLHRKNAKVFSF